MNAVKRTQTQKNMALSFKDDAEKTLYNNTQRNLALYRTEESSIVWFRISESKYNTLEFGYQTSFGITIKQTNNINNTLYKSRKGDILYLPRSVINIDSKLEVSDPEDNKRIRAALAEFNCEGKLVLNLKKLSAGMRTLSSKVLKRNSV